VAAAGGRGGAPGGGRMTLHFDAGKYALFLWPAYGLSAATLIGLIAESLLRSARWRREAEAREREEPRP